jgi:hypothetical protein
VFERARGIRRRDVARLSATSLVQGLFAASLLQPEPLLRTIERFLPVDAFANLRVPLTVTTADLDSGELVLFGDGGFDAPLLTAVAASTALPLWFPPVVWEGRRLVDGGFRGVLPLAAGRLRRRPGGGGGASPGSTRSPPRPDGAPRDRTTTMRSGYDVHEYRARAGRWRSLPPRALIYVRPTVAKGATFAVQDMARYEEAGYQAAVSALAEWSA